jgi:hypothetical protein
MREPLWRRSYGWAARPPRIGVEGGRSFASCFRRHPRLLRSRQFAEPPSWSHPEGKEGRQAGAAEPRLPVLANILEEDIAEREAAGRDLVAILCYPLSDA